jgi:hypothetical protein
MFGVEMRTHEEGDVYELIGEEQRSEHAQRLDRVRAKAREGIRRIQWENQRCYDKKRKPAKQYTVGDVVLIKKTQFGVGQKLRAKYLGPYRVIEVRENDRYQVQKIGDGCEGPRVTMTSADFMKEGFVGFEPDGPSQSGGGRVG